MQGVTGELGTGAGSPVVPTSSSPERLVDCTKSLAALCLTEVPRRKVPPVVEEGQLTPDEAQTKTMSHLATLSGKPAICYSGF